MKRLFQEKLGLESHIEIEQAHGTSSRQNNMNNDKNPQTVKCNLLRYKGKVKILQKANKLRGTNIFINEDFNRETMELHKQLWKEVKEHRDNGIVAYLSYRTVAVKKEVNLRK